MSRQDSRIQNRSYWTYRPYRTYFAFLVLVVGSVFGLAAPAHAQLPHEQLYPLLNEANSTFQQANASAGDPDRAGELYGRAILLYEKIIDQGGIHNARLYYNLANAYFLTNDLGRAILNYRRAEQLDRRDVNIRNNLAFARSQRLDKVAVKAERRMLETLFFWHYDFSLRAKFFLACLFFAILCITATFMVWLGRGPATMTITVLSGILLSCFLASVAVETHHRGHTTDGVVTASEIMARQGDGLNYSPSFQDPLHAGTEFELVEQRPGWFHIELSDGSDAWIPDDTASLV